MNIAVANSSTRDDLTALLHSNTSPTSGSRSPVTASAKAAPSANPGDRPAVVVDLSDRAKAMLEKNKADQLVADRLDQQISSAKNNNKSGESPNATTSDISKLFDALSGRSASKATSDTKWEAGAPDGDPTTSDEQFLKDNSFREFLLQTADVTEQYGLSPDLVRNMRDAATSGTFKIQKASEVLGLNFTSHHEFTPSAVGGGYDGWGTTSQNPTGATKEAIDQGKAIAMWTADRGDVYISW